MLVDFDVLSFEKKFHFELLCTKPSFELILLIHFIIFEFV